MRSAVFCSRQRKILSFEEEEEKKRLCSFAQSNERLERGAHLHLQFFNCYC